jgi:tyrosine-protein kinase Etk/Wzc
MQKVASPFLLNVGAEENTRSHRASRQLWISILRRLLLSACISIIITLSYTYLFNQHYQVQTQVWISNPGQGSAQGGNLEEETAADQEINERQEVLRSSSSLLNVVQKLNLSVRYSKAGFLHSEDLYLKTPLRFQLIRAGDLSSKQLQVKIVSKHSFLMTPDGGNPQEYTFDTIYTDQTGSWRILRMPNLGEYMGDTFRVSVEDPARTADELLSALEVNVSGNPPSQIDLALKETNVLRAVDILQELCAAYLQSNQVQQEKLAQLELRFIRQRLRRLELDLAIADKNVIDMQSKARLSADVSRYLELVRETDSKRIEADLQLEPLHQLQDIFSKARLSRPAVATLAASAPSLNFAILHLQQLQNEYLSLTKIHLQQDPEVSMVSDQMKESQHAIQKELERLIKPLDLFRNKLRSDSVALESRISGVPLAERELAKWIRRKTNLQQLYASLMEKKESASMGHAAYLAFSKPENDSFQIRSTWPLNYSVATASFIIPAVLLVLHGLFGSIKKA